MTEGKCKLCGQEAELEYGKCYGCYNLEEELMYQKQLENESNN